jgi:tyrosinase
MRLSFFSRSLTFVLASISFFLFSCSSDVIYYPPGPTYNVRKNITELSAAEKADYVAAVLALKNMPSPYDSTHKLNYYDQFVYWHLQAFLCNGPSAGAAHMGPAFLPWHRQFLLLYEKALNQATPGKNITVPYWDFTDPSSFSVIFADDLMGGGGDSADNYAVHTGAFKKGSWTLNVLDPSEIVPIQFNFLTRAFGTYKKGGFPTSADITSMLAHTQYDVAPWDMFSDTNMSFRNDTIWSSKMHNVVHLLVGGIWQDSVAGTITAMTSPNDPAFFLLHSNLDRLWAAWEARHPNTYEPTSGAMMGQNRFDKMWPYSTIGQSITPDSMLTTTKQGYIYSTMP